MEKMQNTPVVEGEQGTSLLSSAPNIPNSSSLDSPQSLPLATTQQQKQQQHLSTEQRPTTPVVMAENVSQQPLLKTLSLESEALDAIGPLAPSTPAGGFLSQLGEKLSSTASLKVSGASRNSSSASALSSAAVTASSNMLSQGQVVDEIVYSLSSEDYELGKVIGFGSSAVVYVANYKPASKIVAIKSIDLDQFERNQIDELRKELQVMSLCKHPNLLNVKGSFVVGSKLFIVTPFLSAGSCLDIMKTAFPDGLDEVSISVILKQALQGLDYLHKNGLIHRDIKAGNLLMDEDGSVKLADFGVSSSLYDSGERNGIRKTFVGTPCWIAPEVVQQTGHNSKADIWSFGITSLELAHGRAPFAKYPPMKVLLMTLQNDPPTLDRNTSKKKFTKIFKEMIDSCLQKDPTKRPTAEKLLQHPFFKHSKKKNVLVDSIIKIVPPVTDRAHREMKSEEEHEDPEENSWDFDVEIPPTLDQDELMSSPNTPDRSPHSSEEALNRSFDKPKRPSTVPDSKSTGTNEFHESKTSTSAAAVSTNNNVQQQKKGRFVVDVSVSAQQPQATDTPLTTASNATPSIPPSGQVSALHSRSNSQSASHPPQIVGLGVDSLAASAGEVRKGRFQVIGDNPAIAEEREVKDDDKKGRFELRTVSVPEESPKLQPQRLASPPPIHALGEARKKQSVDAATPTAESLRKGRFEVSSANQSNITSPTESQGTEGSTESGIILSAGSPPISLTSLSSSTAAASFVSPAVSVFQHSNTIMSSSNNNQIPPGSPPQQSLQQSHSVSQPKNVTTSAIVEQLSNILSQNDAQRLVINDLKNKLTLESPPGNPRSANRIQQQEAMKAVATLTNMISAMSEELEELRKENTNLKQQLGK